MGPAQHKGHACANRKPNDNRRRKEHRSGLTWVKPTRCEKVLVVVKSVLSQISRTMAGLLDPPVLRCLVAGFIIFQLTLQNVMGNPSIGVIDHTPSEHLSLKNTPEDLCSRLPDGAYPDYSQACRMFFACAGGRRVATFWCTKGFVFGLTSGRCEPPDRAKCPDADRRALLDPGVREPHPQCGPDDGVYPSFSNGCGSFYVCKDGMKTDFKCPEPMLYDWKTRSCREPNMLNCKPVSCTDREDGFYGDIHSGCKRYFQCRSKNITEYMCPEGTIFNARHHRCTRSATTRCFGTETSRCSGIPDGYYPDYAANCKVFGLCMNGGLQTFNCPTNTLFDSGVLTCETDGTCLKPDTKKCMGKTNGIHPDYESGCKNFFMCLDGLLTHQGSCPQGKLLNPATDSCQPVSLAACTPVMDPDCGKLEDGIYPDYGTGCSAYFVCLGKKKVSTAYCPGNNLYDLSTGKCLPSTFVLCRDHSSFTFPPRLLDIYNCDNRIGIYPEFSSDCRRYVTCAFGYVTVHECPDGSWFNPTYNECHKEKPDACQAPFAVATFQCLPGEDGVYMSSNCTEWHECRNGVGFTNACPTGQQYSLKHQKCIETKEVCLYRDDDAVSGPKSMAVSEIRNAFFDCSGKTTGIYPDSQSCHSFHFCVDGKGLSYSCIADFMFDAETQSCSSSIDDPKCRNISTRRMDERDASFVCEHLHNGMYADLTSDCRRYFVCENGKTIPVYCPERQKFNSIKMMCDREEAVQCLPQAHSTNSPDTRSPTNRDEMYHVYKPDELYTEIYETYSYIPAKSADSDKNMDVKLKDWDYEKRSDPAYEGDNAKKHNDGDELTNTNIPNSITNRSSNKRYFSPKQHNTRTLNPTTLSSEAISSDNGYTSNAHNVKPSTRTSNSPCPDGNTGFFPDYESGCKKFHICFRTIRKTYSCPSVLMFNPESKNCDLPENVACSRPEPLHESAYKCSGKANQFIPDYASECRYYVGCDNNKPFRYACPKDKLFNPATSTCEAEAMVTCEYASEGANSSRVEVYNRNSNERSPSFRHVHGIPGQFYFDCSNKPDGFYPDYIRHCHVFYRCVRGKKFSHYCKQGLLFNPETGICDFEENVMCSPANKTIVSKDM